MIVKKDEIKIGRNYKAKVSGKWVAVNISSVCSWGGWNGKNLLTGRLVHIKTAARLHPYFG